MVQRNILIFLQTETALIYDAVRLFSKALHELDLSQNIDISPLSCDGQYTWKHGNSLVNFMKLVTVTVTGTTLLYRCFVRSR